jgi:3-dehydroquinate synthase
LTADLPVNKKIQITSSKGVYSVELTDAFQVLSSLSPEKTQLLVDEKVFQLYREKFDGCLSHFKKTFVVAEESNKNIDKISAIVASLVKNEVKLDHSLVAIGGGITQDITCFIASTLFRGMSWAFVPTTLLAQADSCIGSKSSINVGDFKNLMGTFYPPKNIYLDPNFLSTLEDKDISSGIGEILKVHMVKGISFFETALEAMTDLKARHPVLLDFVWDSLLYKKELIEVDEFDKGPRNVMNYGHSYGHAIESATHFAIPHGVAVTLGMDMANFQSYKMNRIHKNDFLRWHSALFENYCDFAKIPINVDAFMAAIQKDKKNIGRDLSLILVSSEKPIEKVKVAADEAFRQNCKEFLESYKDGSAS